MTAQPSFAIPDNLDQLPPRELERYFLLLSPDQLQAFPRESLTTSNIVGAYRMALERQVQLNPLPPPLAAPTPPIAGPATPLPPGGAPLPDNAMQLMDTLNAGATGQPGAVQRQQQPTQAIGGPAIEAPAAPTVPGGSINLAPIRPQGPQAQTDTGIPSPTLVQMNSPPPLPQEYRQQPQAVPPLPPEFAPAGPQQLPPPGFRAPAPVPTGQWFAQQFGPERAQETDAGFQDIARHVLDPRGWEALTNANRTTYQAQQDAAAAERAARPRHEKIADWTRSFFTGLTFRSQDEIYGFLAGIHALVRGEDFAEAREFRTNWERQQQAAFEAENPVGAIATEIAGATAPALLPSLWAARGVDRAERMGRGASVGFGEGALYGFNAAEGGLSNRAAGAWQTAWPTGLAGAALPWAAPYFARGTTAAYNFLKHPVQTSRTGLTAVAPAVIPAERVAAAAEFDVAQITRGQATGNLAQQVQEQEMLRGVRGEYVQQTMRDVFNAQDLAVRNAAERLAEQLGGQAGRTTVREAAEITAGELRRIALAAKTTANQFYEHAEQLNPAIAPESVQSMPQRVATRLANDNPNFPLRERLHPAAYEAMQLIDEGLANARFAQDGMLPLNELIGIRRVLNNLDGTSTQDGAALQMVRRAYDNSLTDMFEAQLFSGDPSALQMWRQGDVNYSRYLSLTRPQTGDPVSRNIAGMIRENSTPEEIANWLYGSNITKPSGPVVRTAQRVREVVGEDSEAWQSIRGAAFMRLMFPSDNLEGTWTAAKLAQNVSNFVSGRGQSLAATLFTVDERDLLRRFANTIRLLEVPTAARVPQAAAGIMKKIMAFGPAMAALLGGTLAANYGWQHVSFAIAGVLGQSAFKAEATRRAVRRALSPISSQPAFRDPEAAARAVSAAFGFTNLIATPRLVD